ncbi:MAG: glutamate-1-semialdehyde 2,1-aminomutase [Methanobacteriaceae archaeon]
MNSQEMFEVSKKYLPGGVDSPIRAFKPYPFFAKSGNGSKITDIDGNEYIDHCLAYGPLILGHVPTEITKSITKQLQVGTAYGAPTKNEINLAKEVVNRVPSAEMVRFVNSGTEATMSAIRLARGVTGRDKIVKFEGAYHGAHDYCLVKSGSGAACLPDSKGIPKDTTKNTLSVPFNNEEAIKNLIKEEKNENRLNNKNNGNNESGIAAIILEPVMGNIGCIEPKPGYLEFLREITKENNIMLIFDEVITGFRASAGGAQEYYGIKADISTFGKILGGGFPMGAFSASREIMENIAPIGDVYQAGTFNGNPISITAGLTMLNSLNNHTYKSLSEKGDYIRNGIREIASDNNYNVQVVGLASMFQIYINSNPVYDYSDAKNSDTNKFYNYFRELLDNGVFIPPSQFECNFISTAHSKEDLDKLLVSIDSALKKVL